MAVASELLRSSAPEVAKVPDLGRGGGATMRVAVFDTIRVAIDTITVAIRSKLQSFRAQEWSV